ncbi:hypothetical protein TVAG_270480 [Trichomonas vaginalis G3]|uniref:BAR domain-containing protein n=1 Tax=Trichomonas vaginalis (strain ATCC PRA-98 / G3) TaxID=412133 RepID=A2FFZ8_TRIV3|nr:BAR/IMD domain-like family [Trichomonas vaginalis G3]EAX96160.1 hypothetical protein TVAG_270480 [Trichomonas vaginalis G3]KAI5495096.1 BAR/IMD domain-like family [Trichomonas vaginalis G3]|eukprot:XP_001309090.1 hypothetical protein [Trichomonas vaginalis G3]
MQTHHAKEKVGWVDQKLDPKVEDAKMKLKQIESIMYRYQNNIFKIIESIPKLNTTCREFSRFFVQCDMKFGGKSKTLTNTLDLFFESAEEICDQSLIKHYDENLKSTFKEIQETIDKLKEIKAERHNIRLLKCAYESRLESLTHSGDPESVATTRIAVDEKTIEFNLISEKFVRYVNNLWNIRVELIERPMQELVALVFEIIKGIYLPSKILQTHVSKEELMKEYLPSVQQNN